MKNVWKKAKVSLPLLSLGLAAIMVGCAPVAVKSNKGPCGVSYKASCAKPARVVAKSHCGVANPCVKPIIIRQKPILVTQPALVIKQPTIRVRQPAIRVKNPPVIIEQPQVMVKPPEVRVQSPKIVIEKPKIVVEKPNVSFRKGCAPPTCGAPQPVMVSHPVMMQKPQMAIPSAKMNVQK